MPGCGVRGSSDGSSMPARVDVLSAWSSGFTEAPIVLLPLSWRESVWLREEVGDGGIRVTDIILCCISELVVRRKEEGKLKGSSETREGARPDAGESETGR